MTTRSSIVLFAHGARDPEWAAPFHRIAARLREARPNIPVRLAFLELMQPALGEAVAGLEAEGITRITVVPLFLAQGGHLKEDLPQLLDEIRVSHRDVTIDVTPAIGDSEALTSAIADWALAQHLSFPT
ncbi:MAG TPA: CbiX/SirB N-terminal domain-containing protein [Burkholderiales bacterium]|nr:CbiX/SirB N-terminal domain-containing protein [Burkholderiales bacterium]